MSSSRKDSYDRANRLQRAIRSNDDFWESYLAQEAELAANYLQSRLARTGSGPLVLQGMVGAAAQLAGMGSNDNAEFEIKTELHETFEQSCRIHARTLGNPNVPPELWTGVIIPEFTNALTYFDERVIEGSPSYSILFGMVAATGRHACNIGHLGSLYNMREDLHSTIETLFDGGCEMKREARNVPPRTKQS